MFFFRLDDKWRVCAMTECVYIRISDGAHSLSTWSKQCIAKVLDIELPQIQVKIPTERTQRRNEEKDESWWHSIFVWSGLSTDRTVCVEVELQRDYYTEDKHNAIESIIRNEFRHKQLSIDINIYTI